MKGLPLVILILAAGAVGCDESPTGPTELVDITWKLESVARVGSALVTVPNPEQFTIRFETNGAASVRADCNSCSGRYVLDGASISIQTLACTRVACPTPGLDQLYTSALENVRAQTVANGSLILTGSEFISKLRQGGVAVPGVAYTNIITRNDEHCRELLAALEQNGYPVESVNRRSA